MNSSVNIKNSLLLIASMSIGLWLLLIHVKDIPAYLSIRAFKEIPSVAGYLAVLLGVFSKWLWRWKGFQGWLVTVPNLNGTWHGELQTTWINPETGTTPGPNDSFLVIRQSLYKIHFTLITAESKSSSRAAGILVNHDTSSTFIEFTYQNNPSVLVQNRSTMHDGAASLELTTNPEKRLTGKYWTDRSTQGQMNFRFFSREFREVYA